jgi:hypothetical protein
MWCERYQRGRAVSIPSTERLQPVSVLGHGSRPNPQHRWWWAVPHLGRFTVFSPRIMVIAALLVLTTCMTAGSAQAAAAASPRIVTAANARLTNAHPIAAAAIAPGTTWIGVTGAPKGASVTLLVNGATIGTDITAPYAFRVTARTGAHTVQVRWRTKGAALRTARASLRVAAAPPVKSSPAPTSPAPTVTSSTEASLDLGSAGSRTTPLSSSDSVALLPATAADVPLATTIVVTPPAAVTGTVTVTIDTPLPADPTTTPAGHGATITTP